MSSSRGPRVEELAWKMWRVADVPNDKGLQLATLESLCQYLAGHLPVYFVKHAKRSISWLMKFPSIEAANSAEQHHYKNRKIREHDGTHWRLRLLSQDYKNVLTKLYGYGPLSPPGINHFLRTYEFEIPGACPTSHHHLGDLTAIARSHHASSSTSYSDLPGWQHISYLVALQEVYPAFRHPYFRCLHNEFVSNPPIPPPPEEAKSTSFSLDNETRQLDPASPEPHFPALAPITMDLSEDFRLDFSSAQMNAPNGETYDGYNQFLAENGDCQLDNFKSDLSDALFGAFLAPSEGLDFAPAALPAIPDVNGGDKDLFEAFFQMDG
ncbi:hypothetical protein FS837_001689 [Tulasnella sp. UAMH 9824]|nr:hypothetical protein FS837_001689 [Tulasnella sp. UAMH 9824]